MSTELSSDPVNLIGHVAGDGRLKSMPGYMAADRIRRLIRQNGNQGMASIADLVAGDASLEGLDRPDILDQVLTYGKFNVIEFGDEVYISVSLNGTTPAPAKPVPGLRAEFEKAVKELDVPLVEALLKRSHPKDLAKEIGARMPSLIKQVRDELNFVEEKTGLCSKVRKLCAPNLKSVGRKRIWSMPVYGAKKNVPELTWMPNGLLAMVLAHFDLEVFIDQDGTYRRIVIGKGGFTALNRPVVPPKGRRPRLLIEATPAEAAPERGQAEVPDATAKPLRLSRAPSLRISSDRAHATFSKGKETVEVALAGKSSEARRQEGRQRLWDRILKTKDWDRRRSARRGGASSRTRS